MKKILFSSNFSKMKTGFGRNAREVLMRLHKAGYEVVEFAAGGARDGSNELKATPWKSRGVIPPTDDSFEHLKGNEQAMNAMLHGHFLIDQVIREEKPDVIIFVEDIWWIQGFMTKPWWNKIPCIVWTPIDSCPMMPVFKDWRDRMPHLWVKADFAKRELAKDGVSAQVVPCLIDQKPFFPLPDTERFALRKNCGLEDSFVVGFVFRNQLRKLSVTLMEAFHKFKTEFPESKGKLLLHTNFFESNGWNLPLSVRQIGLNPEDVLTTYVCKKCKRVQVIPFSGNELNCGACRSEKSLVNVTIDFGTTESELNSIYNLMDCYAHPATSGGHEVPLTEAMLAGVPCGTINYSFGETYVNGGATAFESSFYREHTSNFLKAQPSVESVYQFIKDAYLNRQEYRERGAAQRAWAQSYFDPDKHAKFITDYIDALPQHDYDFQFSDVKDVDFAPNYSIYDNTEFVMSLFSGIFGTYPDPACQEVQKCVNQLAYSSREDVVKELKHIAMVQNERNRSYSVNDFIKPSDKKKVVLVEPGDLTECVVCLTVLKAMRAKFPLEEWDHYISCKPDHFHVFSHLEVGKIPYSPAFAQPFFLEGHAGNPGFVDVALQPYLNPGWMHNGLD